MLFCNMIFKDDFKYGLQHGFQMAYEIEINRVYYGLQLFIRCLWVASASHLKDSAVFCFADDVTTRHVYCEHSDNEHGQSVSKQKIQTFIIQIP